MTAQSQGPDPVAYTAEFFEGRQKDLYNRFISEAVQKGTIPNWVLASLRVSPAEKRTPEEMQVLQMHDKGALHILGADDEIQPLLDAIQTGSIVSAHAVGEEYQKQTPGFTMKILNTLGGVLSPLLDTLSDALMTQIIDAGLLPEEKVEEIQEIMKRDDIISSIYIILYMLFLISQSTVAHISANMKTVERHLNEQYRPDRPGFQDFLNQALWNPDSRQTVKDLMGDAGIPQQYLDDYLKAVKEYMNPPEIYQLLWREIISLDQAESLFEKAGYTDNELQLLLALTEQLPPVQDVIRFAVRDAFNPQAVREWGLDEDYPDELTRLGRKWGYSDETLHHYWRAHWQMPSPFMIFEAMHRRVITTQQAEDLLRVADWPKPIREMLLATSYKPLTRVDVRRMQATGVLDRKGVYNAYLDVGFSPENAELMTEFTIRYNTPDEFKLSKSDVTGAYRDRIFTRAEAVQILQDLGYSPEESDFILLREDLKQQRKEVKVRMDTIEKKYRNGDIDSGIARSRLGELGIADSKVSALIENWNELIEQKAKRPSDATLKQWYLKGIIKELEYRQELRRNGWSDSYIDNIIIDVQTPDVNS